MGLRKRMTAFLFAQNPPRPLEHAPYDDVPDFIQALNLPKKTLTQLILNVHHNKTSFSKAIVAQKVLTAESYYAYIANYLNLEMLENYQSIIRHYNFGLKSNQSGKIPTAVKILSAISQHGIKTYLTAPNDREIAHTKQFLLQNPQMAHRIKIVTPKVLKSLHHHDKNKPRLKLAIDRLRTYSPKLSASHRLTATQYLAAICFLITVLLCFKILPLIGLISFHLVVNFFYFTCIAIRVLAAVYFIKSHLFTPPNYQHLRHGDLPIYSVLVALYHEEAQIKQLVTVLSRLNWPEDRLEIKLICESDDEATIQAIQAIDMPQNFSLIIVPDCQPKTKPKALNYALPSCKGDYVVLYDAEDIPHKDQLLEAYFYFQNKPSYYACFQSPLLIHNYKFNWLSTMFAIEYSALFDGLLPALSELKTFIPLGGTSNHFKREILETVNAWDPFNVTEDADLGMRILRHGYKVGTLNLPTLEEAPISFKEWKNQRSRWFKGWMQTWFVHMREPVVLLQKIGIYNFACFHILTSGMILSALLYPSLLASLFYSFFKMYHNNFNTLTVSILCLDIFIILWGYLAFMALALKTLNYRRQHALKIYLMTIPVYWLVLSIAAWRALFHFFTQPFKWEKTEHGHAVYFPTKPVL